MKYIFGPVNSRRLGLSLGIDLVPHKTCTLNCIYCECGNTTDLTLEVKEYIPVDEIISELDEVLKNNPELDAITFSGGGEPTLHSGIGRLIDYIKREYAGYRIAVLTNGTLLWDKEIRERISRADIVIPSLDAVREETFNLLLRPHPEISPERVLKGIIDFSRGFSGRLLLEIFIVPGINDSQEDLASLKDSLKEIAFEEIHLNSLDRPGAAGCFRAADKRELEEISRFFKPCIVKIIGKPGILRGHSKITGGDVQSIIGTVKRRPSTLDEISAAAGIDRDRLKVILEELIREGIVAEEDMKRGRFYSLRK